MSSGLHQFVNYEVKIHFPLYEESKGEKAIKNVGKIYSGVLSKVTDNEIMIVSPFKDDFIERDGNTIEGKVISEDRTILKFISITITNYILEDKENQAFLLKYPSEINFIPNRDKPRVNTRIPGHFNLFSLKGKLFPLEERRRVYKTFLLDVSEGGAQIGTTHKFPEGLRITITFTSSQGIKMKLDGDLVWKKYDRGLYRYGVVFIGPTTDEKSILRNI